MTKVQRCACPGRGYRPPSPSMAAARPVSHRKNCRMSMGRSWRCRRSVSPRDGAAGSSSMRGGVIRLHVVDHQIVQLAAVQRILQILKEPLAAMAASPPCPAGRVFSSSRSDRRCRKRPGGWGRRFQTGPARRSEPPSQMRSDVIFLVQCIAEILLLIHISVG